MKSLTKDVFENKIQNMCSEKWEYLGEKPCVIDFMTDWCSPCSNLEKILDELELKHEDIEFYKVDAEEQYQLVKFFNVQTVPTTFFCTKEGYKAIKGFVGKKKYEEIITEISKSEQLV